MAISVRLAPALEEQISQEARRLGITKSEFVKDAIERALGLKNPAKLLKLVRSGSPMGDPTASANVSLKVKERMRAKRSG